MTTNSNTNSPTLNERPAGALNGWPMTLLAVALGFLAFWLFTNARYSSDGSGMLLAMVSFVATIACINGFFTLQPNEAAALVFFGSYKGTVRQAGFFWTNPFNKRFRVSLRARNLTSEKLKVNDKRGNPIEIGAVVVWRVRDTAQALFDVEDYENFVRVQSESAVRHLASSYSYDEGENGSEGAELTLRGGGEAVAAALTTELQERLSRAGVEVQEARLTHLAYAPEIAQAMLRRQQAEAVIAARQKIVQGAVSMVQMALEELQEKNVIEFDKAHKAAMVGNLLMVLCSETQTSPVINAGMKTEA